MQPPTLLSVEQLLSSRRGLRRTWLYGNEINDPQNLGALIRTASFFGVDGLILDSRNGCPLSPTVSKTSAGALEAANLLMLEKFDHSLFAQSISQQFTICYAGVPDLSPRRRGGPPSVRVEDMERGPSENLLLIMGSEGLGVKPHLQRVCKMALHIAGGDSSIALDSLNVNAAAAVLLSHLTARDPSLEAVPQE